ncbi:MAG: hypothetical protein JWP00_4674 [Chloroflexi bacterium]|nr:hypothetical protein [Chloroflexota bacterium]
MKLLLLAPDHRVSDNTFWNESSLAGTPEKTNPKGKRWVAAVILICLLGLGWYSLVMPLHSLRNTSPASCKQSLVLVNTQSETNCAAQTPVKVLSVSVVNTINRLAGSKGLIKIQDMLSQAPEVHPAGRTYPANL